MMRYVRNQRSQMVQAKYHTNSPNPMNPNMLTLFFRRSPRKHRWIWSLAALTLLNTLVALFVTYGLSGSASFSVNWVFSMLIGACISTLADALRWLIWRGRKPHSGAFLLVCMVAAVIGYYAGLTVGKLIYGIPLPGFSQFFSGGDRMMVIMCILISLAFGIFFWNQSKLAELRAEAEHEKARTAATERQAMQARLQLLQAQIEPHMLFNTLANLQGLIAIDATKAQYMLEQLILYLRASLSSSRTDQTTLKQEFALMKAYLELLAVRMGKRLTYHIDLPAELLSFEIAPMLLQPIVENAIKHGVEPKMAGGSIHVAASLENTVLHIKVSDTGMGLPADYRESKPDRDSLSHVGNANVRDRLLALYGPDASLHLRPNQPEGVIAHLRIPLPLPLPASVKPNFAIT